MTGVMFESYPDFIHCLLPSYEPNVFVFHIELFGKNQRKIGSRVTKVDGLLKY